MSTEVVKVAVSREDGSVAILSFVTVGRGPGLPYGATWRDEAAGIWQREPTDENVFHEISKTFFQPPLAIGYRRIVDSDVPADRAYRDSWTDDGRAIGHDMAKARAIHLEALRRARAKRFAALDAEWTRAVGQGRSRAVLDVETKRQALRDLPQTLDVEGASTIEELKRCWSPLLEDDK